MVRAKYIIIEEHTNKNDFLADRKKLEDLLSEKYGAVASKTYWKNDLYKDKPQDYGMAVSVGHMSMYSTWKTGGEEITLALRGDNFKIVLNIEYSSTKFSAVEDAKRKESESKGL
jgi:hypothetical protein